MDYIVKPFIHFVNEQDNNQSENSALYYKYADQLNDFKQERDLRDLLKLTDSILIDLKVKYLWNYEFKRFSYNHFSLNIKIHVVPDPKIINQKLKVNKLTENQYADLWASWLVDQEQILFDDINFSWVKDVAHSGTGFLLIRPSSPDSNFDFTEDIIELLDMYIQEKNKYKNSEEWLLSKNNIDNPNIITMVELGMLEESDIVANIKKSCLIAYDSLLETKDDIIDIRENLDSIQNKINEFKKNALNWFYEYLEMEREYITIRE